MYSFYRLDIESSPGCDWDVVDIDGHVFCGTHSPEPLAIHQSEWSHVIFTTDSTCNVGSFLIHFKVLGKYSCLKGFIPLTAGAAYIRVFIFY